MKDDDVEHPSAKHLVAQGMILSSESTFDELIQVMYGFHQSAVIIMDAQSEGIEYYIITHSDIIRHLNHIRLERNEDYLQKRVGEN